MTTPTQAISINREKLERVLDAATEWVFQSCKLVDTDDRAACAEVELDYEAIQHVKEALGID